MYIDIPKVNLGDIFLLIGTLFVILLWENINVQFFV